MTFARFVATFVFCISLEYATAEDPSSALPPSPDGSHLESNEVYRWLQNGESENAFSQALALPKPKMPDGLTGEQQTEVIREICKDKFDWERFVSERVSAPHFLRIDHDPIDDSERPIAVGRMSLFFVAKGELASISDPEFLNQIFDLDSESETSELIPDAALEKAGIQVQAANKDREFYTVVDTRIFDRIQLNGVGHSLWTQTEESILLALHLDQRFAGDTDYAPRWERFERQDDGSMKGEETGAFPGAGVYVKITRLKDLEGLLFVEAHGLLLEPYSWFRGRSLIVSKLPPAIQSEVRDIRRRALTAGKK